MVAGDIIHMDASLIRANVSFDSLVAQHLEAVADEGPDPEERLSRSSGTYKKLCVTDPDAAASFAPLVRATLAAATSSAGRHLEPSYKQHTAVDDRAGIVVDVDIVTGEESDAARMAERLDQIAGTLGRVPGTVTADAGYGVGQVYAEMAARAIDPLAGIPSNRWRGLLMPCSRQSSATGTPPSA